MLKENIPTQKADNRAERHVYYVRTDLSTKSDFLKKYQARSWVEGSSQITLTKSIPVSLMHEAMKQLSLENDLFFASIRSGGTYESL